MNQQVCWFLALYDYWSIFNSGFSSFEMKWYFIVVLPQHSNWHSSIFLLCDKAIYSFWNSEQSGLLLLSFSGWLLVLFFWNANITVSSFSAVILSLSWCKNSSAHRWPDVDCSLVECEVVCKLLYGRQLLLGWFNWIILVTSQLRTDFRLTSQLRQMLQPFLFYLENKKYGILGVRLLENHIMCPVGF